MAEEGLTEPMSRRTAWSQLEGLPAGGKGAAITVGTLDGVHRGHWTVLARLCEFAEAEGLVSVLVTFDPHPLKIVRPEAAPRLLTTPNEKKEILTLSGLDYAVFLPFTRSLSPRGSWTLPQMQNDFISNNWMRVRQALLCQCGSTSKNKAGNCHYASRDK